jgi:hypothetical protein
MKLEIQNYQKMDENNDSIIYINDIGNYMIEKYMRIDDTEEDFHTITIEHEIERESNTMVSNKPQWLMKSNSVETPTHGCRYSIGTYIDIRTIKDISKLKTILEEIEDKLLQWVYKK